MQRLVAVWGNTLGSESSHLAFPDISHELALQLLGAKLATYVQSTFLLRDFLIPGAKIKHRAIELRERSPHQPPAIIVAFEDAAVWTGTPIEDITGNHRVASVHRRPRE
jgi:hypothetical protein